MSEAQIDQSITHAELRVPPPNEAEAAAFAKYHGKSYLKKRSMIKKSPLFLCSCAVITYY